MDVEMKCPKCGERILETRQMSPTSVWAYPCMCVFEINHSLTEGAVMSDARNNPEPVTEIPSDGPQMGLMLPDKVLRKSDFPVAAAQLNERLLEYLDTPNAFVLIKQIGEIVEAAEKALLEPAMKKCAGATVHVGTAKVAYKKKPGTWDYKNDPVRDQLTTDIATLTELLEKEEAFLQNLTQSVTDDEGRKRIPAVKMDNGYTLAVTFEK